MNWYNEYVEARMRPPVFWRTLDPFRRVGIRVHREWHGKTQYNVLAALLYWWTIDLLRWRTI